MERKRLDLTELTPGNKIELQKQAVENVRILLSSAMQVDFAVAIALFSGFMAVGAAILQFDQF